MRLAIESYITHGGGGKEGEDLTRAKEDLTLKDSEIARLKQQLLVKEQEGEDVTKNLTNSKEDLTRAKEDLSQLKADAELKWRETNQLRSEINQAKRELETSRSKIEQLQTDIDTKRDEAYQACNEAESLRRDQDHYKDTLAMKDKQIGFLEGHVAQLTQSISQFALNPGEEEIKKKGWWKFWK
jgi:chromosome segregation ATPase